MSAKVARAAELCQEQVASPAIDGEGVSHSPTPVGQGLSNSLDESDGGIELSHLRAAVDEFEAWTQEALAAELRERGAGEPSGAYVGRMLSGEKPWTLKHTSALPREIRIAYHARALRREGVLVVLPTPIEQAAEALVSGLFGVIELLGGMANRLPTTSNGQIKAALPSGVAAERRQA
jgi:hypothetical protein